MEEKYSVSETVLFVKKEQVILYRLLCELSQKA